MTPLTCPGETASQCGRLIVADSCDLKKLHIFHVRNLSQELKAGKDRRQSAEFNRYPDRYSRITVESA